MTCGLQIQYLPRIFVFTKITTYFAIVIINVKYGSKQDDTKVKR